MQSAHTPLTTRIILLIRAIPKGKVASYGQIAALAGSPRGARQVVRVLHSLGEKEKLPWHRVINSAGRISMPMDGHGGLQAALLRKERVEVSGTGAIDLKRFGWKADAPARVKPAGRSIPVSSRSRTSARRN
jgi:methylated-DNA-protein-cysteine methyltransferase-like protein